jgi:hypothetical protein
MAFKQFTECIEPSEYVDFNHLLVATIQGLLVGATATALAAATSRLECWLLVLEVTGIAWVIAYCRLFLYQRLICLGGDRDCIGVVVHVSTSNLTGFPDNDYSVDLLLQPNEFGADRATVEASTPYGYLVKAQDKITAAGLPTEGNDSKDEATVTESEILHIEFEGGGAYALLIGAEVGFVAAVAALILCVYLPPIPQLQTIIQILAALGILVVLLGSLIGLGTSGSPSDAGTNVGELHTNTEPNNGQGAGADIIYVSGTWVYDPWHEGWNEIHPVKVCTKMGTWRGDWDTVGPDIILKVRTQFELAASAETLAAQKRPEHQWVVHPALDACAPVVIT